MFSSLLLVVGSKLDFLHVNFRTGRNCAAHSCACRWKTQTDVLPASYSNTQKIRSHHTYTVTSSETETISPSESQPFSHPQQPKHSLSFQRGDRHGCLQLWACHILMYSSTHSDWRSSALKYSPISLWTANGSNPVSRSRFDFPLKMACDQISPRAAAAWQRCSFFFLTIQKLLHYLDSKIKYRLMDLVFVSRFNLICFFFFCWNCQKESLCVTFYLPHTCNKTK